MSPCDPCDCDHDYWEQFNRRLRVTESGLTYGELFAGYDGLGMGVRSVLGGETRWYAEFDKAPSAILAHHYPGVPNLGDVTKVRWGPDCPVCQIIMRPTRDETGTATGYFCNECTAWYSFADVADQDVPEPVDVITGGSPCQDLSHAGKRAGMKAGTRSGLWASMCDAIETIRPRLVVWENVRGALSAEATSAVEPCPICVGDGGRVTLRALGRVLGDLAELGYDARWYGLRAADVGAAHGRFRVFLFATPADATGLGGHEAFEHDGRRAAPGDGRGVPDERHRDALRDGPERGLRLLPSPRTSDTNGAGAHGTGGPDLRTVASLLPTPTDSENRCPECGHLEERHHFYSRCDATLNQPASCLCLLTPADIKTARSTRLLPTPRATRGGSGTETLYGLGAERSDANRPQGEVLLPTPRATDGTKGGPNQRGSSGDLMLPSAVGKLLPTPRVASERTSRGALTRDGHWSAPGLAQAVEMAEGILPREYESWDEVQGNQAQDWREYEAAIRRQETAFGRPAPLPTEPGNKGQPRLSPRFVEWLMGLPDGWVTDVPGISRNDQLKALGNGVVPPQAAAATRAFLEDTMTEARTA